MTPDPVTASNPDAGEESAIVDRYAAFRARRPTLGAPIYTTRADTTPA